jgi:cytochrome P450
MEHLTQDSTVGPTRGGGVKRVDELGVWLVTRAATARSALTSPTLSANWLNVSTPLHDGPRELGNCGVGRWFIFLDGERHRSLRSTVAALFAPARIRELAPEIEAIVAKELSQRLSGDEVEVAVDLAPAVTGRIICHVTGMPLSMAPRFKGWSDAISDFLRRDYFPPAAQRGRAALEEMAEATARALEHMHEDTTAAAVLRCRVAEGTASREDAIATLCLLIYAGFGTTTTFLANAVYEAVALKLLKQCNSRAGAAKIIEELLRLHTSAAQVARVATADTRLAEETVAEGELILIRLGEADRDPEAFTDPDAVRPSRSEPNLAFGYGPHYCLGAAIARVEAAAVMYGFATQWPKARVLKRATKVAAGSDPRTFTRLTVLRGSAD